MGFYDRDYTQDHFKHRFGNAPQMRMKFPQMTPAVKKLLIANIAVFFIGIVSPHAPLVLTGYLKGFASSKKRNSELPPAMALLAK